MADTCPKCGQTAVDSDKCPGCGVIIPLYLSYLEKVRRGPTAPSTARSARPPTTVARPQATVVARPTMDGGAALAAPAAAMPSAAPSTGTRRLVFHGSGHELWGIHIVNMFRTLVTLGWYSPWAKTRVRNYLWANTEIENDRFAYHGTGKELFIGYLKALALFIVPMTILNSVPDLIGAGSAMQGLAGLLASVLGLIFGAIAIASARRYRLSRTSWRGIRFSFRGDIKEFIWLFVVWVICMVVTLGFYYPAFITQKYAYLTNHSYFGSARFAFDGAVKGLFKPFLRVVGMGLATIIGPAILSAFVGPLAGLAFLLLAAGTAVTWFKFLAAKRQHFWDNTKLGGATFASTATAGGLAKLYLGNGLLLAITLGFAMPWVKVRNANYACATLTLTGALDLASIRQDAMDARATGEALSGLLGGDLDLG